MPGNIDKFQVQDLILPGPDLDEHTKQDMGQRCRTSTVPQLVGMGIGQHGHTSSMD